MATNELQIAYGRLGMPAAVRVHAVRCGVCGRKLAERNETGKCLVRCVPEYNRELFKCLRR